MPDFDITIKTPTELAGAVAAAEALERDIGKAKALGQEFGDLQKQLDKVKQSIKEAEDAGVGGGEGFKLMGKGAHDAHASLHALGQVFPGLQQLGRFLTSGFTLAIGAALVAFEYLNKKIEEFSKMLDDLNSGGGARGEWAQHIKENAEQAAVAFATWEHHIDRLIAAERTLGQLTDAAIALDKQKASSDAAIAAAQKELADAQVDLGVKLGQIAPEVAIKMKLQIDEAAFKAQLEAKAAGIQAEIDARTKEKHDNRDEALGLHDKVRAEKDAADAASAAKTKNDDQIEQAKKDKEAADAAVKRADERLDKSHTWGSLIDTAERETAKNQRLAEEEKSKNAQGMINIGMGKKKDLDIAAESTKENYEADKALYEEHVKADRDLTAEITKLTAQLAGQKAENAALGDLHNKTAEANAEAAGAGAGVQGVISQAQTAMTNANFESPRQAQAALMQSHDQLVDFVNTHADITAAEHNKIMAEIAAINKKISTLFQNHQNRRD